MMKEKAMYFVAIIFTILFTSCGKKEPQTAPYYLNTKENAVLGALLQNDLEAFAYGGDSYLGRHLERVTSKQIAMEYDKNEVAADAKYKNKEIFVSAKIVAIQSGINDEPFLTLSGVNLFQSPQARFKKTDIDRISKLEKAQDINIVCVGGGEVVGTAMLNECIFSDVYGNERTKEILSKFDNALAGNKETIDPVHSKIFLLSVYISRKLPETSPCGPGNTKECIVEIEKVLADSGKTGHLQKELKLLAAEFNKYGFTLPTKSK